MRGFFRFLRHFLIVSLLTLFSQIGGLIWLLSLLLFKRIDILPFNKLARRALKTASFSIIYLFFTAFIIPPLAKWQCGRVPLPVWSNPNLKPQTALYFCLLNHHYVRPELKAAAEHAAEKMVQQFPGTRIYYLDANFPFFDGYPLEPHFSHRDGRKLDIALYFQDKLTGQPIHGSPTAFGYGAFEEPLPGEVDMDKSCPNSTFRNLEKEGFGTYDHNKYAFDAERTRAMIQYFAEDKTVGKILLEPHLKQRLNLDAYDKIRFQGCKAARHDDHIHVQL